MGFGDAVRTCFQKYVEFKGRASRPEYWWFFLSYAIVYVVGLIIVSSVKGLAFLLWIVLLAYFLPLLAAAVRRLHDTGTLRLVVPDRADPDRRVHHPDRVPRRGGPARLEPVRGSSGHGGRRTAVPTAASARVIDRRRSAIARATFVSLGRAHLTGASAERVFLGPVGEPIRDRVGPDVIETIDLEAALAMCRPAQTGPG